VPFLNGRIDLAQAESVIDIISAKGKGALAQAESHLSGALSKYVHTCREELKNFITRLEVTIDYPEGRSGRHDDGGNRFFSP
jgi:tRNA modification GTPase